MKTYTWLIKREFWENRGGFFWAPVITTSVFLILNIMAIITFEVFTAKHNIHFGGMKIDQLVQSLNQNNMADAGAVLDLSMMSATSLLGVVLGIVVFFYCLGSLYDDRKDRSILFWKSLPISDRDTVFSKVISAGLVAPVISAVCGMIAGLGMLVLLMLVASFHGVHLWSLLGHAHPIRTLVTMIAIIPVNLIWALPAIGWLMLCSAWARNRPFLWAIAIPVGTGIMASWFDTMGLFNLSNTWMWKNIIMRPFYSVVPNTWMANMHFAETTVSINGTNVSEHFQNLTSIGTAWSQLGRPDFLIGAAIGIAMIFASIWFRGRRDDS